MTTQIILASESPRRYSLLKQMGLDFETIPSNVKEDAIPGETPEEYVLRIAEEKASGIMRRYPEAWIISADTIVYIDNIILGKPENMKDAEQMLSRLSGREHFVFTGIFVCNLRRQKSDKKVVKTGVKMKKLSPMEIQWYINTDEPYDKAGGYAAQGIGSVLIESINGSYTNVVGLPLCELFQMLMHLGAIEVSKSGIRVI